MGASDLNFSSGFSSGLNTGFGILNEIDARNERKKQSARAEKQWQWQQEDRQYTVNELRPVERERNRLGLEDLRSSVGFNVKARPIDLQSKQLGLDDLEGQVEQNKHMRPLQYQSALADFNWRNQERDWATEDRPVERRSKELELQDKESLVDYNTKYRPVALQDAKDSAAWKNQERDWATEDRPQDVAERQWKFDALKTDGARKEAQYYREQQQLANQQAYQYLQAAQQAHADGDMESAHHYMNLAEQKGIPISMYLNGQMDEALSTAEALDTGKADMRDPVVQSKLAPLVENTMRSSGRAARGMRFAGFVAGTNGRYIPMMANSEGKLVPATHGMTSDPSDPIVQLSPEELRQAAFEQGRLARELKQGFGDVGQQYSNPPKQARLLNPSAGQNERQVQYDNGLVKQGGTRSWRNNNPGNLEYGAFAKKYGAIGTDGRFAIFPNEAAGEQARIALLKGKYGKSSIKDMVSQYAPGFENDTARYGKVITQAAGVGLETKISDLNDEQFFKLTRAMRQHEDWKAGQVIQNTPSTSDNTPYSTGLRQLANRSDAAMPPAPPAPESMDKRIKRRLYELQGAGALPAAKPKEQIKQWSKLDEGTLYNEYTGETKAVKGGSTPAQGRKLTDMYDKDGQLDPAYHAKMIDTQFPDMPFKERQMLLAEVGKAKDPVEAEQVIGAKRLERDTNELADTLIKGVDSDLLTPENKLANSYQVLHQKARELGVSESDLRAIAKDSMGTVGDQDQVKLIEEIGLRLKTLEQDKAYEKRQKANADQYRANNATKRREQYQHDQSNRDAQSRLRELEMQQLMGAKP